MPFSDIVGHHQATQLLQQAVRRGRVPQSLLFAGPEGVGKRAVAIRLAQAVNCPRAVDGDGCGACPTCQRIAGGRHSDVVVLDKGGEASIKIRALRERVLETIGYRAFESRRRVYIIDPADEMTVEAQDALLKTLEEPPPAAILMLVTAYPDTLLATIQSRCRRLRFAPLSETDVARVLTERAGVTAADARRLAAASAGSVSRALAERSGSFDNDRDAAMRLLEAAGRGGPSIRLKAAAALAQHGSKRRDREALADRLAILGSLLRDLGALHAGSGISLVNVDLAAPLGSLARAFDLDRVVGAYDTVHRGADALERNASPKIVADWLAVMM